ncbi:aspartate aminotransferase family protein [Schlesneria paludicola]|uniref:aspartate aminotransferase family protein n=1 Tax=Schlesneria paludicola TaxID=360056 RepID=UPI00029B296F|nr:aspartate aminotransferase family protein [Schlesneria paludicola]
MHPAATRTSQQTIDQFGQYVIPNYKRYPVSLVHGEGNYVWDAEGKRYLDLFPGWGCNILGHCPPRVVKAIQQQVEHLIHIPNTWFTEAQGDFAEALVRHSFGKVFFANSGTEANEGAIKLARLHYATKDGATKAGGTSKYRVISFTNGFHGRTFGSVTATAQPKYHEGLGPLLPGFRYAPYNDFQAVESLVDDETCAILLEPVQGEGGVNIATDHFLRSLRELCDQRDMLLIFDEVQTGMGRTGEWFGYQQSQVQPDIMTLAKGVAAGVACGAFICQDHIAPSLRPGMHASTFGGNPLAMAAGIATMKTIEEDGLLENCRSMSDRFRQHFEALKTKLPIIKEVRTRGMMIGVELNIPATPAVAKCMERGVLINATHDTVVRLLPALNITPAQVDEGCQVIAETLELMASEA